MAAVASRANLRCCASTYGYATAEKRWRGREKERTVKRTPSVLASCVTQTVSSPARTCRRVVPQDTLDRRAPHSRRSTRFVFVSQTQPHCREHTASSSRSVAQTQRAVSHVCSRSSSRCSALAARSYAGRPCPMTVSARLTCQPLGRRGASRSVLPLYFESGAAAARRASSSMASGLGRPTRTGGIHRATQSVRSGDNDIEAPRRITL
mmetsp:Transcript_21013/g.62206  ORF Transcript_21013/g.62206 Transcript_21013/m.62206 type:complete len:208 (+) Transcript_21013:135-758(+)